MMRPLAILIVEEETNIAEETIFISEARVIKHHAEEGEIT